MHHVSLSFDWSLDTCQILNNIRTYIQCLLQTIILGFFFFGFFVTSNFILICRNFLFENILKGVVDPENLPASNLLLIVRFVIGVLLSLPLIKSIQSQLSNVLVVVSFNHQNFNSQENCPLIVHLKCLRFKSLPNII